MSGDPLTVFLALLGFAVSFGIAAFTQAGWRGRTLWAVAAVFVAATIWFPFRSHQIDVGALWGYVLALEPVLIIACVALMVPKRKTPPPAEIVATATASDRDPMFSADRDKLSKWTPDIGFEEGFVYLGTQSQFALQPRTVAETTLEMKTGLASGKITAWAKVHPEDDREYQVRPAAWQHSEINTRTNYVFFRGHGVAAYDVRLCQEEIERVWPRKG